MQLRVGYQLVYECPQPTPMILTLNIHYTRVSDLLTPDHIVTSPSVPIAGYRDGFGNWCSRIVAPQGEIRIATNTLINDSGLPDTIDPNAMQHAVEYLPAETLVYLLGSRYCETDRLSETAWDLFGHTPLGWARVQAICDFVHASVSFDYMRASATRRCWPADNERSGSGFRRVISSRWQRADLSSL